MHPVSARQQITPFSLARRLYAKEHRGWFKCVLLFVLLAGTLGVLQWLAPEVAVFTGLVDSYLPTGLPGYLLYILLTAGLICVAVPRQLLSFAGGYAFGVGLGTLLATVGVTLGCVLAFSLSRFSGRRFVERRFAGKIVPFNAFLSRAPFLLAVLIRLFPSGNNLLFSLLAGVSRIPAAPFFLGSCLGYIPQNLVFALLGSGAHVDPLWRTGLSAVLFAVTSLLGWWLYRRYRAGFP